jgi:hypothetical protein
MQGASIMTMRLGIWGAALCLLATVLCARADVSTGQQWLASTAQPDGSYYTPATISTPLQATAETLRAFSILSASGNSSADQYLSSETYHNTENLARLIIDAAIGGHDSSALAIELLTHQDSASGGLGELPGYQPTVLDTSFALEALALSGNLSSQAAGYGVNFLQQRQATDGSWTDGDNAPSVYLTALSLVALRQYASLYSVASSLQAGSNFLLSMRQSDGLWGQDFLSGESLISLLQTLSDPTPIQSGISTLQSHQNADGSWAGDTFTTAVVLRALALAQGRGSAGNGTGAVQGYVTQAGSSQPIAGATVAVSSIQGLSVQTDAAGFFALSGLPVGNLTLIANKAGFSSASGVVNVIAGKTTAAANLVLSPGSQSGTLRVHLIDATTGAALSGATVAISGPAGSASAVTDNSGDIEFDALTPGSISVSVQKAGYQSVQATVMVSGGQILNFTQPLQSSTTIGGSGASTLTGTIIDAGSSAPISGAVFSLSNGASNTSGSDGSFSVSGLSSGPYTATVSAAGYATQTLSLQIPARVTASLGSISLYPSNDSSAPNTVTLVGTVVDGLSNKPLAGVAVTLVGGAPSATSNAQGQFTLVDIPSLSFQLHFAAAGYSDISYSVTASAYGSVSGTFALPPVSAGGSSTSLQGHVTDAASGIAIGGASVQILGTSDNTQTDASGAYQLQNLSGTQLQLQVSALNYATRNLTISLNGPGNYTLDVQLDSADTSAASGFQVLSLSTTDSGKGANTTQLFTAQVGNQASDSQEGILVARILDSTGKQVASASPYAPGTSKPQSDFMFAPQEIKTLQIPWNPVQLPPGAYTVELDVVKPGTITRDNPSGTILAENSTFTSVSATQSFLGTLAFNPPAAQAGSSAPVTLEVLVVNSGNVDLVNTPLNLTIKSADGSTLLDTVSATLAQALPVGQFTYVSFGTWLPSGTGNLPVSVSASDSGVSGQITGTLYVGDKPQGSFAVTPTDVFIGTQTVQGTVNVTGVDKAINVQSPLVTAIRNAVQKGSQYVATNVVYDQNQSHCLRCHVQTQSYYGLASLLNHDVGSDQDATQFVYNALATSQQDSGGLHSAYTGYAETQTVLGLWALTQAPDKIANYQTEYRAAKYMQARATTSGSRTYWNPDYGSGWWANVDTHTMMTVKGYVDLLQTAQNNSLASVNDYSASSATALGGATNGIRPGPDGALYALQYTKASIVRYDVATGALTTVVTGLPSTSPAYCSSPLVIAANEFYVPCPNQLVHVLPDGTKQTAATLGSGSGDIAMDSNGTIYVSDYTNNRILRGTVGGSFSVYASGGLLNSPFGLAVASDRTLYVANYGGFNVLKIDPAGSVSVFADGLSFKPLYLALQTDGTLYASHPSYYDSTSGQTTPDGLLLIDSKGSAKRVFSVTGIRGISLLGSTLYMAGTDGNLRQLVVSPLDTSQLSAFSTQVTGAANYFLNEYNDGNANNIYQSVRLIGLAEARNVITDPSLQSRIDQAIGTINSLLRSRQRSDGGWGLTSGYGSDAMVTALVGTALDYLSPAADDQVVLKTVQYLLNNQASDGSWYSADGIMSTRFAATGLVMAYLPRVLDRIGGLSIELHLDFPANIKLANPSVPPSGSLTNPDGSSNWTWMFNGVTSSGRVLNFNLTLSGLQPGEQRPAASAAYLLSANSFDSSQVRVDLPIPTIRATDQMALTSVSTDSTSYAANSVVQISGTVLNSAPAAQSGSVVYTIKAADGSVVATLSAVPFSNLASNASTRVNSSWNTGTTLAGSYAVVGDLYNSGGTFVNEQTTSLSIASTTGDGGTGNGPNTQVSLRVTTDKQTYNTTDQVDIGDLVRNISANGIVDSASLQLSVRDPNGTQVFSVNDPLGQLTPGYTRQLSSLYGMKAVPIGDYSVSGYVVDAGGAVLASGSASFKVIENLSATVTGTETVQSPSVYQGDPQTCTDGVSNRGTLAATGLPVRQLIVNLDEGTIEQQTDTSANLDPGASKQYVRSFTTGSLALGHHACVIQAQINGTYKSLASAAFEVVQPPVRVTGSMGLGDRGRVLVLLDDPTPCSPSALCRNGLLDLGLQANFNQPLSSTAAVQVTLQNASGKTLDTETASIDGFTGEVDEHAGTSVDLALTALTPQTLIVRLSNLNGGNGFDGSYRLLVTTPGFTLDTGVVRLDCQSLTVTNASVGTVFQVTSVNSSTGANPGAQGETLTIAQQQDWLHALLAQNGWSHEITTSKEDFTTKFRSGDYQTYLLYAEYQPLQEQVDKELREAINNGEGLAVAGWPDPNHSEIADILGVQNTGRQPCPTGVQMSPGNPFASGQISFTQNQPVRLFSLSGAALDGTVLSSCVTNKANNAVTHHVYGKGQSAYVGFDLLAEASAADRPGLFTDLILKPLAYVNPKQDPPLAGRAIPVRLIVTNVGIANSTQIKVSTSMGGYVLSADAGSVTKGVLNATFDLAAGETKTLNFWVQTPAGGGPLTVTAQLTARAGAASASPVTLTTTLNPTVRPGLDQALSDLQAYVDRQPKQKSGQSPASSALKLLQQASKQLSQGNAQTALSQLVQASDQLIKDGSAAIVPIRLEVDEAIYQTQQLQ